MKVCKIWRDKAHFEEENVGLEKLKAELAAEPIGVPIGDPKTSGARNGVDVLMEDSAWQQPRPLPTARNSQQKGFKKSQRYQMGSQNP